MSVELHLATSAGFELGLEEAAAWLAKTSALVSHSWEACLRKAGMSATLIEATASVVAFGTEVASDIGGSERAVNDAMAPVNRRRRPV